MLTIFLFEETCCSMQGYASDHSSSCQFGHGHRCIGMRLRSCICCIKKCGKFLLNLLSWGCISMDVLMSWCYGINKHTFVLDLRSPNLSIVSKLYFKGMMHFVVTTYRPSSGTLGFLEMTNISNLPLKQAQLTKKKISKKARHPGGFHSSGQLRVEEGNRWDFPFDLCDDSAMLWNFSYFQVDQGEMSSPLLWGKIFMSSEVRSEPFFVKVCCFLSPNCSSIQRVSPSVFCKRCWV